MIRGYFIEEQKTRFLCNVLIEGEVVECYMPSSCKLGKIIDLSGREVLLKPVERKNSRTSMSIQAIKLEDQFVWVNLSDANRVIEEQIQKRCFSFLGNRTLIEREKNFGNYKADLYITKAKTIVEVKTVLSVENSASFPTYTVRRAERQLESILELLDSYTVCYIVVSLNPKTRVVNINESNSRFCELFRKCVAKGMICKGFKMIVDENYKPKIKGSFKVLVN